MTGLLICAAVVASAISLRGSFVAVRNGNSEGGRILAALGLVLIAVALWLAYAAGGAG